MINFSCCDALQAMSIRLSQQSQSPVCSILNKHKTNHKMFMCAAPNRSSFTTATERTQSSSVLAGSPEPSCKIGAYSVTIFRKVLYRKWPSLALSLSQYRALFADIAYTNRCGIPVLEKSLCASQRKSYHDKKAVISMSIQIGVEPQCWRRV